MAGQTLEEQIAKLKEQVGGLEAFSVTLINVSKNSQATVAALEKAVKESVLKINDVDKVLAEYRDAVAKGEAVSSGSVNEDDVEKIVKKIITEYDLTGMIAAAKKREEGTDDKKVILPPQKQTKKIKIVLASIFGLFVLGGLVFFVISGGMNKKIRMDLPIGTILMQNGKIIGKSSTILSVDVDSEGKFTANGTEYQINKKSYEEASKKKP